MSISEYISDKRAEWRFHSSISHNKVLGKGVWDKIMAKAGLFDPEVRHKIIRIRDHQMSMETDEEWFRYVGSIARTCPSMPKEQRLPWVIDELYRRAPQ